MKDIKGTVHVRMGMIKDRNSKNLREAQDIKKRWQKYTELYKKVPYKLQKVEGTHVYLWLIHVDVWKKSSQYCKVIILQLK